MINVILKVLNYIVQNTGFQSMTFSVPQNLSGKVMSVLAGRLKV